MTEDIRLAIILTCSVLTLHNFLIDVKDAMTDALNAEVAEKESVESWNKMLKKMMPRMLTKM